MKKIELDGGNIILYQADALEVLQTLERNSIEIAITSPPYNLCKRYSDYTNSKTSKSMTKKYEQWYADEMPEWEYQGFQQAMVHEMLRVCNSSIFYNHKVRFAWHNRNIYRTSTNLHHPMDWLSKFPIWCEIIWDRCGIGNPSRRYHIQEERIYQIGKPKQWDNPNGLTNIWKIPPSRNQGHVCTFPEKLVENCMFPTTTKSDVVLDPYMGAGTTGVVATKHGRRFIGVERVPEYFDLAVENIKEALKNREDNNE